MPGCVPQLHEVPLADAVEQHGQDTLERVQAVQRQVQVAAVALGLSPAAGDLDVNHVCSLVIQCCSLWGCVIYG